MLHNVLFITLKILKIESYILIYIPNEVDYTPRLFWLPTFLL